MLATIDPVLVLGWLLAAMGVCLLYLTVDWLIDEMKRSRANKRELEHWHALYPNEKDERTKTNK